MFIIYSTSCHSNLYNFLFFPYFKEYFKNRIGPIYKNTETFLRTTTFVFHRKFLSNQKPTEKIIWRNKKVFNEQTLCGKLWMFIVPWIHLKLHYEISHARRLNIRFLGKSIEGLVIKVHKYPHPSKPSQILHFSVFSLLSTRYCWLFCLVAFYMKANVCEQRNSPITQ